MLKAKNLLALVVVTALVVVAAAYSLMEKAALPEAGAPVYPDLLARVNDVEEVQVSARGKSFLLKRGDEGWVAPERGGYPLDGDKVHMLLVGASALRRVEPKTSNPELYPRLGVEDPDSENSSSVRFSLKTGKGDVLADFIAGESTPAKGDATASEYFIRQAGDAQSWLVQGRIPRDSDTLTDWLSGRIAAVSSDRIHQVRVTHPDGEVVTVQKDKPGDGSFRLLEAPPGVEVKDTWRLNDMGRVLADLSLEDVLSAEAAAGSFQQGVRTVEVRSLDGLVVTMEVVDLGEDEHLARLKASFDEQQAQAAAALKSDLLLGAEAVREEVARLNSAWSAWVYRIPRYKADFVGKRVADLVPAPAPAGEDAPPKS